MPDCMIDLETNGNTPGCGILTIGAIKFERNVDIRQAFGVVGPGSVEDLERYLDTFYVRVSLPSLKDAGLKPDADTVKWWAKQKPEVRQEAWEAEPRVDITTAMDQFYLWFGNSAHPWSHGDDFDCVLLDSAARATSRKVPWFFTDTRDTRTVYDLAGLDRKAQKSMRSKMHHHALVDCYDQIVMLQESFNRLGYTQ